MPLSWPTLFKRRFLWGLRDTYAARDTGKLCSDCTEPLWTAMIDISSRKFCAKKYEEVSGNPYGKNVCFERNYVYELVTHGSRVVKGPLHMSPVNQAGSVSEISPRHSFLRKIFDVFIWEAGLEIEHSSPVTETWTYLTEYDPTRFHTCSTWRRVKFKSARFEAISLGTPDDKPVDWLLAWIETKMEYRSLDFDADKQIQYSRSASGDGKNLWDDDVEC